MKSILIVAAHPDDEVLGCGGTVAKLVESGAIVNVVFMADGVYSRTSRDGDCLQFELTSRREAAKKACKILGVNEVFFHNFPDNQLDSVPRLELIKTIELFLTNQMPDTIFTHHAGDLNIDHRVVHDAVVTACRPQSEMSVRTILSFEVPSSTEWQIPGNAVPFIPNWFVDISGTLEKKLSALRCYKEEIRESPHPRSISGVTHLANWRGATIGVDAAEAFILGRKIL